MKELKAALEAKDLAKARVGVEHIHDTQHDLSKAAYAWLGSMAGASH